MSVVVLAGLCTLDVIQLVAAYPADNEKVTALAQTVAAGGPATNAAATVAHLGGEARLLTAVGSHPLAAGIHADLAHLGVHLTDLAAGDPGAPAVSSIVVSAGNWKPVTPQLLPLLDVVVCSADFRPPGTTSERDVAEFLTTAGVRHIAISRGAAPLLRWTGTAFTAQPVPQTEVIDTLGAGDVLHGAITLAVAKRWPLTDATFAESLHEAATIATRSCTSFGTRSWMTPPERVD